LGFINVLFMRRGRHLVGLSSLAGPAVADDLVNNRQNKRAKASA